MPICAEAREIAKEIWDALVAVCPGKGDCEFDYANVCDRAAIDPDYLRQQLASQLQRSTNPLVSEAGYYLLNYCVGDGFNRQYEFALQEGNDQKGGADAA